MILALIATFGFSSAFGAGFDGRWEGAGSVTEPRTGNASACDYAEIVLERTPQTFFVSRVAFHCGPGSRWQWKGALFDIRGEGLFRDGIRVGSITPRAIVVDLGNDDVDWRAWFELEGPRSLSYVERLQSTEVSVELSGRFHRN